MHPGFPKASPGTGTNSLLLSAMHRQQLRLTSGTSYLTPLHLQAWDFVEAVVAYDILEIKTKQKNPAASYQVV